MYLFLLTGTYFSECSVDIILTALGYFATASAKRLAHHEQPVIDA